MSASANTPTGPTEDPLAAFVGRVMVPRKPAQDAVNSAMIRHWAEAMEDPSPIYLDDEAARATGRASAVAPVTMVQAWTMRGYAAHRRKVSGEGGGNPEEDAFNRTVADAGYPAVVATDSEFRFERELVVGDRVHVEERLESVSSEKVTGLGRGRFVDMVRLYTDDAGELVATQRWRTLRYLPKSAEVAAPDESAVDVTLRPRPAINRDNAFWFAAARERRLVIQRCQSCGALRHPPSPCCPQCQSFEWDTVEAEGRGVVHSYTVAHHPQLPGFRYPHIVAVVELAEGTRLITNLVDCAPEDVAVDAPVLLDWLRIDEELTLPVFRLVREGEK